MTETVPMGTILYNTYRIERVLGSGGFGHVYMAVNLTNQQPCAVKEYLVTGQTGQDQLKHEATVLSTLNHPNLPAFLNAFMEGGKYYVVLSYIEGHDLTDLLRMARQRNESIPTAQIVTWILSMCEAVSFLHRQRPPIIHRDIKPDNIRITPQGKAMLVDLGNAKAASDGSRTLIFIRHQGTPGYAPPEQYPGGTGTDARSDIYALGATLYFALVGSEPPSVSARNQALQKRQPDVPTLQDKLLQNPPENDPQARSLEQFQLGVNKPGKPRPRHSKHLAQLAQIQPEILTRLNQIILRAMAMRPRDRYQNLMEFTHDLRSVVSALTPPNPQAFSTQPDLPQAFQALQDARERQQQSFQQVIPETPVQVSPAASLGKNCPRCDLPVVEQAQFCPRCGASLIPENHLTPQSIAQAQALRPVTTASAEVSPDALALVAQQQMQFQRVPPSKPQFQPPWPAAETPSRPPVMPPPTVQPPYPSQAQETAAPFQSASPHRTSATASTSQSSGRSPILLWGLAIFIAILVGLGIFVTLQLFH